MGSLTLFQLGYCTSYNKMGRVRTKTVKKAAKLTIEKYYTRLTLDFHVNKRICEGISIKLQEEERERRDNYVPETSVLDIDTIEIDVETKDMLKMLELGNIPKLQVVNPKADMGHGHPPRR